MGPAARGEMQSQERLFSIYFWFWGGDDFRIFACAGTEAGEKTLKVWGHSGDRARKRRRQRGWRPVLSPAAASPFVVVLVPFRDLILQCGCFITSHLKSHRAFFSEQK